MSVGSVVMFVPNLVAALAFYEAAFGFRRRFVDAGEAYAELESDEGSFALAAETLAVENGVALRPRGDVAPVVKIALVVEEVEAAFARAVAAGAEALAPPGLNPWGDKVAYVRDCCGAIVELSGSH